MEIIKRLFGSTARHEAERPSQTDAAPVSRPMEIDPQASTRRELVRVVTRDTLRDTGIPEEWIETQILLELVRDGHSCIHLRLVVRHWDPRLLKYAVAFQRRLLAEMESFDPQTREWLLSIAWQFPSDEQCPFLEMPDPATWTEPVVQAPAKVQPKPRDELQEDLAQLYAVRDADLAQQSAGPDASAGKPPPASTKGSVVPDILL
jgi:hypothetical protein